MPVDIDALKSRLTEYDPEAPRCPQKIARTRNYAPDYITPQHAVYSDYDLTTYEPCCRPEGHDGECSNSRRVLGWPGYATVKALIAEVERLRAEAAEREERTARIMLEAERHRRIADEAIERIESAEEERAAVVKWLHRMERNARHWGGKDDERADTYARLADVFDCGEHREENE